MINESIIDAMVRMAKEAMAHAHSPYSGRPVGACVMTSDGTLYGGCSVENASYGLSCCAERVAIFKAIADKVGVIESLMDKADERTLRRVEHARERFDLRAQQEAGIGGKQLRDAGRRCVRAMGAAERIVDIEVAERCELFAECRIVLLLACVEAQVLEQHDRAVGKLRHLRAGILARHVGCHRHRAADELGEAGRSGNEGEIRFEARAARTAEMAHEHDFGAPFDEVFDGGKRRFDTGVVGHAPVGDGNVEIDADEDSLAGDLSGLDALDRHGCMLLSLFSQACQARGPSRPAFSKRLARRPPFAASRLT